MPRTDKPRILRPNSFQGNAFEIVDGTAANNGLVDLNGECPDLPLILRSGSGAIKSTINPSKCVDSEPMRSWQHRSNFAYGAGPFRSAALRESGTFWIAFKRVTLADVGYYELLASQDTISGYRSIWVNRTNGSIRFGYSGALGEPSGSFIGGLNSLNVLGLSWGSDGARGYFNGVEIWNNTAPPSGTGNIDELNLGTWLGDSGNDSFFADYDTYSARVLPRALSAAEHKAWADDIWLPYRGNQRTPYIVLGGSPPLSIIAESGNYILTGDTAGLLRAASVAAEVGVFAVQGQDAGLGRGAGLIAEAGTFLSSGQDAGLRHATAITAEPGAYSALGLDAGLLLQRGVTADTGSYAVASPDETFLTYLPVSGAYVIIADAGFFSLQGQDVGLRRIGSVVAEVGAYTTLGFDAGVSATRRLVSELGDYVVQGVDANLIPLRSVVAEVGAYSWLGFDAGLVPVRRLAAEVGVHILTGQDAGLIPVAKLTAESGSYIQTGAIATLLWSGIPATGSGTDIHTAGTTITTLRTETSLPLQLSVSGPQGGKVGLDVNVMIRDSAGFNSYLDFSDNVFKVTGWGAKSMALTDLLNGLYAGVLDINAIVNLPAGNYLTVEYTVTGLVTGITTDLIAFAAAVYAPQALTLGKFLALKDA